MGKDGWDTVVALETGPGFICPICHDDPSDYFQHLLECVGDIEQILNTTSCQCSVSNPNDPCIRCRIKSLGYHGEVVCSNCEGKGAVVTSTRWNADGSFTRSRTDCSACRGSGSVPR